MLVSVCFKSKNDTLKNSWPSDVYTYVYYKIEIIYNL